MSKHRRSVALAATALAVGTMAATVAVAGADRRPAADPGAVGHDAGGQAPYKTYTDVPYVAGGTSRQTLDLYVPPHGRKRPPVILFLHGGGWGVGSKDQIENANKEGFLEAGFAVAAANYTLTDTATFPQQIHDVKAAIRYLRANARRYGLSDEIGVMGSSAGAHLATLAGTSCGERSLEGRGGNWRESSCVQAVFDGYAPTDFLQMPTHYTSSAETRYLGCASLADCPEKVQQANPIAYIEGARDHRDRNGKSKLPPFLIAHGDADTAVPLGQSNALYTALAQACADVTFYTLSGVRHTFLLQGVLDGPDYPAATAVRSRRCGTPTATTDSPLTWDTLVEFFDDHLR
jgi:acetyl esterase/lipase